MLIKLPNLIRDVFKKIRFESFDDIFYGIFSSKFHKLLMKK